MIHNFSSRYSVKFLSLLVLGFSLAINSEALTSMEITADTLAAIPQCMHYKILGECNWMSRTGPNVTLYLDQYLPDVVVSVYNKPGENPWAEVNGTIDQAGKSAEDTIVQTTTQGLTAGFGQHSMATQNEQSVYFKEVDVIGNPALAVFDHEIFLPSTAIPLFPYFQSMLDAVLWRGLTIASMPEKVMAVPEDIVRRVGTFPIKWGSVFPIEGSVHASNEAKAAAVIAQRAVNLLTSSPMEHMPLHIFKRLNNNCGDQCDADDFHENDDHTQFQRIYPDPQNTCEVFGNTLSYGNEREQQTHGAYVWIVWRHYRGCVQGDGKYIGKTLV